MEISHKIKYEMAATQVIACPIASANTPALLCAWLDNCSYQKAQIVQEVPSSRDGQHLVRLLRNGEPHTCTCQHYKYKCGGRMNGHWVCRCTKVDNHTPSGRHYCKHAKQAAAEYYVMLA